MNEPLFEKQKSQLLKYYQAINEKDIEVIQSFLSVDVQVNFPDSSRNWQGIECAREKFSLMYQRNPSFHADILNWSRPSSDSIILEVCFGESSHPMQYFFDGPDCLISKISHL